MYDAFGRTTTLPAADTLGATNAVTVNYYANDLVRSQTQGGRTLTWTLDPSLRLRAWTDSTGPVTKTNHYNDSSDSPTWIAENTAGTNWIRTIGDLSGGLALTDDQADTKTWQLTDLHGDVIGAVPDGSTPTYNEADEYGNPRDAAARRYGWLGGNQRSGDALGGTLLMGVRLYSPTLGRFLSIDSVHGGNDNTYIYPSDPVNMNDLDGHFSVHRQKVWSVTVGLKIAFSRSETAAIGAWSGLTGGILSNIKKLGPLGRAIAFVLYFYSGVALYAYQRGSCLNVGAAFTGYISVWPYSGRCG